MGSSSFTNNVYLPIFNDTDKPSWLGDFNDAMNKIDVAFANRSTDILTLSNRLTADETSLTTLTTANAANTSAITALQTTETSHTSQITALQTQQTSNTSSITTLNGEVATINSEIATIQGKQTADESNISALQTQVGTIATNQTADETTLSSHSAELAGIKSITDQINWQILFAGDVADTTNGSGQIGVYHAFGKNPTAVIVTPVGGTEVQFTVSAADSSHFLVNCFNAATGAAISGQAVNFYYIVVG